MDELLAEQDTVLKENARFPLIRKQSTLNLSADYIPNLLACVPRLTPR
jgi:hypothetical protein